ncbi:MAG: 4-hydroxythreonine-4-phosphate dehydrogenase PdxA [Pseudomonadota bacterium]
MSKPRITLLLGDRNGIGPELAAKLLSDPETFEAADITVFGDPAVLEEGKAAAKRDVKSNRFAVESYLPVEGLGSKPGEVCGEAGKEMLACLSTAAKDVEAGKSDGVIFAPLNKASMHQGGLRHEDEMRFIADELAYTGPFGELNVLDNLWTTRVTSHIPIKDVAENITTEGVLKATRFAHETLRSAGFENPRLGVAGLNPHAGDGGNFGTEEIEIIDPAVEQAKAKGINVEGSYPADTVFVRAFKGDFDAVVTMYHDQGQIAMKLKGLGRGVTVLGGLPVPVTTCGHGTGYDIVGQGIANDESMRNAFRICCDMAKARVANGGGA